MNPQDRIEQREFARNVELVFMMLESVEAAVADLIHEAPQGSLKENTKEAIGVARKDFTDARVSITKYIHAMCTNLEAYNKKQREKGKETVEEQENKAIVEEQLKRIIGDN